MNKVISTVALAATLTLVGCQSNRNAEAPPNPTASQIRYSGILPCADCSGIRTSLTLYQDQFNNPTRFQLQEDYMDGAQVKLSNSERGDWHRQERIEKNVRHQLIILNPEQPEERRYFIKDTVNAIELLDQDGNRIDSQFNYRLLER